MKNRISEYFQSDLSVERSKDPNFVIYRVGDWSHREKRKRARSTRLLFALPMILLPGASFVLGGDGACAYVLFGIAVSWLSVFGFFLASDIERS